MSVSRNNWRSGSLLIEVLIGLALSVLFAVAILQMSLGTFSSIEQSRDQLIATNYAYEGLESIRTISRQDFDLLANGTHGVYFDNNKYILSGSTVIWEKFTQTVTIASLYRDADGNLMPPSVDVAALLASGGWEDTQAKLATATVTWQAAGQTKSVNVQSMFTKWFVYPLQSLSATGSLAGSEYVFQPIGGDVFPIWKVLHWNAAGGVDYMQVRFANTYSDLLLRDWIGPDGGTGSYYSVSGTGLSPEFGSGKWLQGKAWLTGTGTAAPIMTVLYE